MCGIIGFVGKERALEKLMSGLGALEYRGYDSAGVAFFDGEKLKAVKSGGRLSRLAEKLSVNTHGCVTCGIGHTRWATHGEPSDVNSHPHGNGRVYAVHNGIIENYVRLSDFLGKRGYTFESETDTERAVLLIDYFYKKENDPVKAIGRAAEMIEGSFALGAVFAEHPNVVYAVRRGSPLLVSPSEYGNFIESDISAVLKYTRRFARLDEDETAVLTKDSITFISKDGKVINKEFETAQWDTEAAEKGGYPHFMLKEIHEEAEAVKRTVRGRMRDGTVEFELSDPVKRKLYSAKRLHIVACGTAMHAGLIGKYAIEKLARIPVDVEIASEFRYRSPILEPDDVVVIISQSGETADSIAALRLAKESGNPTLAIVNVPGSTIAVEADCTLYTWAGPEIAVASTKAYSVQIALLYALAIKLGRERGHLSEIEAEHMYEKLSEMGTAIEKAIMLSDRCINIAEKYKNARNMYFIGRGQDYALSMEAALKMKEISYIHCEAYAAGELKHGTISLIENGTPVIAFATEAGVYEKLISNIREVKSRGADVVLVVTDTLEVPDGVADDVIKLPSAPELFMPLVAVCAAQLTAYHTAVLLGRDVDRPRNLAKSVTVE